jgi:hypothetical protein
MYDIALPLVKKHYRVNLLGEGAKQYIEGQLNNDRFMHSYYGGVSTAQCLTLPLLV